MNDVGVQDHRGSFDLLSVEQKTKEINPRSERDVHLLQLPTLIKVDQGPHHSEYREKLMMDTEMLTVEEVARLLRVSRWTVYKMIKERQLVSGKLGRARRVPLSAVAACIAAAVEDLD